MDIQPHQSPDHGAPIGTSMRKLVHYSGHVQGVGFRYTAMNVALGFDVRGYVRNLPDGRVELVAEGTRAALDAFLQAVQDRMDAFIRKVDVNDAPATGEFQEFSLRH
jgi:acylphosphatase